MVKITEERDKYFILFYQYPIFPWFVFVVRVSVTG